MHKSEVYCTATPEIAIALQGRPGSRRRGRRRPLTVWKVHIITSTVRNRLLNMYFWPGLPLAIASRWPSQRSPEEIPRADYVVGKDFLLVSCVALQRRDLGCVMVNGFAPANCPGASTWDAR
jgi:hypothetical protein